jgi:flavin-dependent dehydrogenase
LEDKPIIIGAGIIGNFLACELTKIKVPCVVIERKKEFGKEACTSLVSKRIFDFIPKKFVLNQINGARIFFYDKKIEVVASEKGYVIDRKGVEEFYFKKAKNANYKMNEKFIDFFKLNKRIRVKTDKNEYLTSLLIGCDGALSIISRKIGNKLKFVTGVQTKAKIKRDREFVEIHFGKFSKDFFSWVVPENDETARIGVASSENAYLYFKKFLKFLKVKEKKVSSGLIPISLPKKTCDENLIIIGDAASQVKAITGGGIITGLICARHASKAIKKAIELNNFSNEFFENEYERKWKKELMRNLKVCYFLRSVLMDFSKEDYLSLYEFLSKKEVMERIRKFADMDFYSNFLSALFSIDLISFGIKQFLRNPKIIKNLQILF